MKTQIKIENANRKIQNGSKKQNGNKNQNGNTRLVLWKVARPQ